MPDELKLTISKWCNAIFSFSDAQDSTGNIYIFPIQFIVDLLFSRFKFKFDWSIQPFATWKIKQNQECWTLCCKLNCSIWIPSGRRSERKKREERLRDWSRCASSSRTIYLINARNSSSVFPQLVNDHDFYLLTHNKMECQSDWFIWGYHFIETEVKFLLMGTMSLRPGLHVYIETNGTLSAYAVFHLFNLNTPFEHQIF